MATQIAKEALQAPHKIGRKQVFLPNFVLTLLRTPKAPPTYATFLAPLNLNKLDLRDYLFHAYGLRILSVRSYIQMQKLVQDKPSAKRPSPRKWFRPRSIKKMTVEMESPFQWPEEPKGDALEKWDKKTFDMAKEARDTQEGEFRPDARQKPTRERESIAEQAKRLLKGEDSWRSGAKRVDGWEDTGEEIEVETDVVLPKEDR